MEVYLRYACCVIEVMNELENIAMRRSSKRAYMFILLLKVCPFFYFKKAVLLFTVHIEYFHLPNRKVAARKAFNYCLQLLFNDSSQSLS
jgi:hypothetical protein